MESDVYLTAKEMADYLKINVQTLYRKVREKSPDALPHIRVGGSIRFNKDAVDKWMRENSIKS